MGVTTSNNPNKAKSKITAPTNRRPKAEHGPPAERVEVRATDETDACASFRTASGFQPASAFPSAPVFRSAPDFRPASGFPSASRALGRASGVEKLSVRSSGAGVFRREAGTLGDISLHSGPSSSSSPSGRLPPGAPDPTRGDPTERIVLSDGGCGIFGGESFPDDRVGFPEDRARVPETRPPERGSPEPMFSSEVTPSGSGAKGFTSDWFSDPARDLLGEMLFRLIRN